MRTRRGRTIVRVIATGPAPQDFDLKVETFDALPLFCRLAGHDWRGPSPIYGSYVRVTCRRCDQLDIESPRDSRVRYEVADDALEFRWTGDAPITIDEATRLVEKWRMR